MKQKLLLLLLLLCIGFGVIATQWKVAYPNGLANKAASPRGLTITAIASIQKTLKSINAFFTNTGNGSTSGAESLGGPELQDLQDVNVCSLIPTTSPADDETAAYDVACKTPQIWDRDAKTCIDDPDATETCTTKLVCTHTKVTEPSDDEEVDGARHEDVKYTSTYSCRDGSLISKEKTSFSVCDYTTTHNVAESADDDNNYITIYNTVVTDCHDHIVSKTETSRKTVPMSSCQKKYGKESYKDECGNCVGGSSPIQKPCNNCIKQDDFGKKTSGLLRNSKNQIIYWEREINPGYYNDRGYGRGIMFEGNYCTVLTNSGNRIDLLKIDDVTDYGQSLSKSAVANYSFNCHGWTLGGGQFIIDQQSQINAIFGISSADEAIKDGTFIMGDGLTNIQKGDILMIFNKDNKYIHSAIFDYMNANGDCYFYTKNGNGNGQNGVEHMTLEQIKSIYCTKEQNGKFCGYAKPPLKKANETELGAETDGKTEAKYIDKALNSEKCKPTE